MGLIIIIKNVTFFILIRFIYIKNTWINHKIQKGGVSDGKMFLTI